MRLPIRLHLTLATPSSNIGSGEFLHKLRTHLRRASCLLFSDAHCSILMSAMPLRTLHTFRLPYLLKKRIQIPTHTFGNMIRSASSESVPVTSAPRKRRGRPKLSDKLTGASKNPVGTYQHKTIETPEKSTTLDETSNVLPEGP